MARTRSCSARIAALLLLAAGKRNSLSCRTATRLFIALQPLPGGCAANLAQIAAQEP